MLHNNGECSNAFLAQPGYFQDGIQVGTIITGEDDAAQTKTLHKASQGLSFVHFQGHAHLYYAFPITQAHINLACRLL